MNIEHKLYQKSYQYLHYFVVVYSIEFGSLAYCVFIKYVIKLDIIETKNGSQSTFYIIWLNIFAWICILSINAKYEFRKIKFFLFSILKPKFLQVKSNVGQ